MISLWFRFLFNTSWSYGNNSFTVQLQLFVFAFLLLRSATIKSLRNAFFHAKPLTDNPVFNVYLTTMFIALTFSAFFWLLAMHLTADLSTLQYSHFHLFLCAFKFSLDYNSGLSSVGRPNKMLNWR